MTRSVVYTTVVGVALVLGSCVKSVDVYFGNPCAEDLRIETFRVPPEKVSPAELVQRVTLPAESLELVKGAFDVATGNQWSLRTEGGLVLAVNGDDLVHETFVLPIAACEREA
jgi:hypothetical protein